MADVPPDEPFHPRLQMQGPRPDLPVVGGPSGVGVGAEELPYAGRSGRGGRLAVGLFLVLALVGAGVAAVLAASSDGSDGRAAAVDGSAPVPSTAADEPSPTASAPRATTTAPRATTTTTAPPRTTTPAAPVVPVDQLPRHEAVYRDGKLVLQGTVPTQAVADRFRDEAAAVIGADNVIVRYRIDDRVPVPTDGRVRVDEDFLFAPGSAAIDPAYEPLMQLGVAVLRINPQARMRIVGHTDSTGSAARNQEVSQQRADALKAYLVAQGIDGSRVEAVGRGPADPVATNDTPEGRSQNRRIEVELLDLLAG